MSSNEKIYISMNSEDEVNDSINFTNENNVFTGQFNIVKDEVPTNIENIFSSKSDIDDIKGKIPDSATSENQLADKQFVTDSISTSSATFRGTFKSESELPIEDVDNNDYAFVNENNQIYTKYKFNGTEWLEEYTFNNTPFDDYQWAAINSGITSTTLDDYVKTSDLENVNFENLSATSLTVDGKQVSLEDHTHSKNDISDFPENVSSFTNDVGYIKTSEVETAYAKKEEIPSLDGYVKLVELQDGIKFNTLEANSLKVDNKNVSLEGHTHTKSEIDDFPENVSDFTNDAGYLTEDDIQDINFENLNATSLKVDNKDVSLVGHKHIISEIEGVSDALTQAEDDITNSNTISDIKDALLTLISSLKGK